jgi:phosphoribosylanthranilate isomerase
VRPKIKISGIMSAEDARAALDLGADYISFENIKTSKRYLDFSQITTITNEIPLNLRNKLVLTTDSGSYDTLMQVLRKADISAAQPRYPNVKTADVIKMRKSGIRIFQYEYLSSSADIFNVNLSKDAYDYAVFDIRPTFVSKVDRFTRNYKVARIVRDIFNEIKTNIPLDFYGVSGELNLESIFTFIQVCKPSLIDLSIQLESQHSVYKSHDRMSQFFGKLNTVFPNVTN